MIDVLMSPCSVPSPPQSHRRPSTSTVAVRMTNRLLHRWPLHLLATHRSMTATTHRQSTPITSLHLLAAIRSSSRRTKAKRLSSSAVSHTRNRQLDSNGTGRIPNSYPVSFRLPPLCVPVCAKLQQHSHPDNHHHLASVAFLKCSNCCSHQNVCQIGFRTPAGLCFIVLQNKSANFKCFNYAPDRVACVRVMKSSFH